MAKRILWLIVSNAASGGLGRECSKEGSRIVRLALFSKVVAHSYNASRSLGIWATWCCVCICHCVPRRLPYMYMVCMPVSCQGSPSRPRCPDLARCVPSSQTGPRRCSPPPGPCALGKTRDVMDTVGLSARLRVVTASGVQDKLELQIVLGLTDHRWDGRWQEGTAARLCLAAWSIINVGCFEHRLQARSPLTAQKVSRGMPRGNLDLHGCPMHAHTQHVTHQDEMQPKKSVRREEKRGVRSSARFQASRLELGSGERRQGPGVQAARMNAGAPL